VDELIIVFIAGFAASLVDGPAQDIYAASVQLGGSTQGRSWAAVVIEAAVLLALVSVPALLRRRRRSRPRVVGSASTPVDGS